MSATSNTTTYTENVSDGNTVGTLVGQSSTDKVGFFGATPVVKQTNAALAGAGSTVLSATLSATGGISNSQSASDVIDAINALANILYDYGLASS